MDCMVQGKRVEIRPSAELVEAIDAGDGTYRTFRRARKRS